MTKKITIKNIYHLNVFIFLLNSLTKLLQCYSMCSQYNFTLFNLTMSIYINCLFGMKCQVIIGKAGFKMGLSKRIF